MMEWGQSVLATVLLERLNLCSVEQGAWCLCGVADECCSWCGAGWVGSVPVCTC